MDRRRMKAALTVVAVAAALMAAGSQRASAAVVQDGPVNYAGVGPCPVGTTDCLETNGDIDVIQTAPTGGSNTIECGGANCVGTQGPTLPGLTPTNTASCTNSTTAASSEQLCDIDQAGGDNTLNANFDASPSTPGVNVANISQSSEQRFVTTQNGVTNTLNVTGNIAQSATSVVDATTPVNHVQKTLQYASNTLEASSSNVINYDLDRSQVSDVTGATPTQLQDNAAGGEPTGKFGLGEINLIANSGGTNEITVRGHDVKNADATSLDLGTATQQQGHVDGGWTASLDVDSATPRPDGLPDIDVGDPEGAPGLSKTWTVHAEGPLGVNVTRDQDQIDDIRLPLLGKSPFSVKSNGHNEVTADAGGHIECNGSSNGHAKTNWTGRLDCDIQAGAKVQNPSVTFSGTDIDASIKCSLNIDACPAGTVNPVSHAHQAVRNLTLAESYAGDDAPASTSAAPNDTVEYRSIFHNTGAGAATGATLQAGVPANTTFVSCSDGCSGPTGGVVTWNLDSVAGGASATRTLLVKVANGTTAGTMFSNKATGDDDQEDPFDSQTTTVTATAPRPVIVGVKIFGSESAPGKIPVGILSAPNFDATTIVVSTLCFGDPDEPARPPTGRDCTVANSGTSKQDVDGDGDIDMKTHFDKAETGIDPNDKTGCVSGYTTDGTYFEGCGNLPKGN